MCTSHPPNVIKKYSCVNNPFAIDIHEAHLKIRRKIKEGVPVVRAVDDVIILLPAKLFEHFRRLDFYNTAYRYYERNFKVNPFVEAESNSNNIFDCWRSLLSSARNDSKRLAHRHASEDPSFILEDAQIDSNFILSQTAEQRDTLVHSYVLAVDQNEASKPKHSCKTLTLLGLYRGLSLFQWETF